MSENEDEEGGDADEEEEDEAAAEEDDEEDEEEDEEEKNASEERCIFAEVDSFAGTKHPAPSSLFNTASADGIHVCLVRASSHAS